MVRNDVKQQDTNCIDDAPLTNAQTYRQNGYGRDETIQNVDKFVLYTYLNPTMRSASFSYVLTHACRLLRLRGCSCIFHELAIIVIRILQ
jgi:hypothetical protein